MMDTGIFPNESFETYKSRHGLNQSALKSFAKSPAHYLHGLTDNRETDAMRLGTAAHCAVLEPDRFARDFVVWCGAELLNMLGGGGIAVWTARTESGVMAPRRGKAWESFCEEHAGKTILTEDEHDAATGKSDGGLRRVGKLWDAFCELHAGKTILTEAEHVNALAMQSSVRACPEAMMYLRQGQPEVSMVWRHDDIGGRLMKGRVDWLCEVCGETVIVGLKTSRHAGRREFSRQAYAMGYHIQWPYYQDGYRRLAAKTARMVEIVVESSAPHTVAVYNIPSAVLDFGRAIYTDLVDQLGAAEVEGVWPGPVVGEVDFELPAYAYEAEELTITPIDEDAA